jgi:signal transduction histidine kinase
VLLDLHLPDSFGDDTVRRMREAFPRVPIVVFPSGRDAQLPTRALRAGAQDYLGPGETEPDALLGRVQVAIERMKLQDEQRRAQSQIEEAERVQGLGVLGAGASLTFHQLLAGVLDHTEQALVELAATDQVTTAQLHLLEARKAALRAADFATELRDYARVEIASRRSIDLSQLVRNARAQIDAIASPPIQITYQLERPGPSVFGSLLDLRQVLLSLVINATESIRPAAGRIAIHTGVIWADRELLQTGRGAPQFDEGIYAELCVRDSGRGLDARAQSRIFDPLYAATGGCGVGLAAALGAVRRQGGWICAASDADGEGMHYRVLFPIAS